jgi:RNA polymerase sigma-70 factor, ECF subfamily
VARLANEVTGGAEAIARRATGGAAPGVRENEDELRELMVRYQNGDAAAVEALVTRLSPALLRFCSGPGYGPGARMARSEAEDLLQDCWLRIHRARHTYLSSEPLLPWIYAVARHARLDAYRRRSRLGAREVSVSRAPERTEAATPPDSTVMNLVNRLPNSQREVILMLKVTGMSLEEVAQATSSTVGAIKQKAHRAYTALRAMLTGGDPARTEE